MNKCFVRSRLAILTLLAQLVTPFVYATPPENTASMAWHDVPGRYTELRLGDRPVLRYMYRTLDETTEQSRFETYKVFHHLFDPSGKQLVTGGPAGESEYSAEVLYPHHRGLFYGFKLITYGNEQKANTWYGGDGDSQQHVEILSQKTGDNFGSHHVAIHWVGRDGKVFANEERELTAWVRPAGTLIEFTSTLKSATGGTIHLDGDPQHAGFQFRSTPEVVANGAEKTYYLRTDGKGKLGETRNWNPGGPAEPMNSECTNRPWNAMSFVVRGKRYTALYLDHPTNPKPARYGERDYGRFGSYFVADVTPEDPLVVRYQLWLQEGEMTVDECTALSNEFAGVSHDANNVAPEGFVALFNGKDLSDWKGLVGNPVTRAEEISDEKRAADQAAADTLMREHWLVVDGELVYDGSPDGANICSTKEYRNFVLMVDWKIEPKGDSGIYLRSMPQVQIWDTEYEELFKHGAQKGSGSLWNNQKHERFPLVKADHPADEWNAFSIKMVDDQVTVKLNGQLVVDNVVMENYWQPDQPPFSTGQIELQKHDGKLWFKNIFIRELP